MGPDHPPRYRPLVASALLHLLPRVGKNTHRSRQAEQTARKRRRKAEFRIDYRCGAIDIHRDAAPLALRQRCLDGARDVREMIRRLKTMERDDTDDGMVRDDAQGPG